MASEIKVDTISEKTSANGVAIDSVTLKDGGATLTGVLSLPDGSASAPAITNTGDTNAGLYFSAADTLAFTAGGTAQITMADGVVAPVTDNDVDIGTSSLEFKDGYFDGTLHCDVLDLAGTEYTSIGGSDPSSADGDSLGTASLEWSDLYLADGSVIYFGNDQEITLTHSADSGLLLKHTATADDKPINLVLQTGETDMAANDVIGKISWQAPDEGTGTDAILVSAAIQAVAEGDHSSSSNATRLEFHTGASELATSQMTISSGGIVGIGAGVPGDLGAGLHIKTGDSGSSSVNAYADDLVIENSIESGITILSGNTECGLIAFGDDGDDDIGGIKYCHDGNTLRFLANASEAVRIGSDGHLNVGTSGLGSQGILQILGKSNERMFQMGVTSNGTAGYFKNASNSDVGNISVEASATAFNTSSDYRLKENVNYDFDATTRLKQLKPARFNWIIDDTNTLVDGFLAHEVSSIVPESITGNKDATETKSKVVLNSTGNVITDGIEELDWTKGKSDGTYPSDSTWEASKSVPVYQYIDQSKLVPLLVKTIQELEARIKTLEDA